MKRYFDNLKASLGFKYLPVIHKCNSLFLSLCTDMINHFYIYSVNHELKPYFKKSLLFYIHIIAVKKLQQLFFLEEKLFNSFFFQPKVLKHHKGWGKSQ